MIAKPVAMRLAAELDWMPGYKESKGYQDSLADALGAVCIDKQHGKSIINRWREMNRFAPMPADIYEIAAQDASERAGFNPNEKLCRMCGGTGWSVFLGPMPKELAASQTPGVVRCECMRRAS